MILSAITEEAKANPWNSLQRLELSGCGIDRRREYPLIDQFGTAFTERSVYQDAALKQQNGGNAMSKKAAEHHKKAAEHLTHAARHHGEAAKHHEAGSHEKAAHHAHTARAHIIHGRGHAEEAVKAHAEEHGKK